MANIQFEETEQASEPELDMPGVLELSGKHFLKIMINVFRGLMKTVANLHKQKATVAETWTFC